MRSGPTSDKLRILLVDAHPPFAPDEVRRRMDRLGTALECGGHRVDRIWLPAPARIRPGQEDQVLLLGLLNLGDSYGEGSDLLVASGFPATLVAHPCRLVWKLRPDPPEGPLWDLARSREPAASCRIDPRQVPVPDEQDEAGWTALAERIVHLARAALQEAEEEARA